MAGWAVTSPGPKEARPLSARRKHTVRMHTGLTQTPPAPTRLALTRCAWLLDWRPQACYASSVICPALRCVGTLLVSIHLHSSSQWGEAACGKGCVGREEEVGQAAGGDGRCSPSVMGKTATRRATHNIALAAKGQQQPTLHAPLNSGSKRSTPLVTHTPSSHTPRHPPC